MKKKKSVSTILETKNYSNNILNNNFNSFVEKNDELDELFQKIQTSHMLYNLASVNWIKVINQVKTDVGFQLTSQFVEEISVEIKNILMKKLSNFFDSKKENNSLDLSKEDQSIIKILVNQIKNKTEETSEVEENMFVAAEQKVEKPVLKKESTTTANRMTISNNPYRKPPVTLAESQARAIMEAQAVASSAGNSGISNMAVSPTRSSGDDGESLGGFNNY